MASSLARTAGPGSNPPVANAKTAQTATTAGTADAVGGDAPNSPVRATRASGYAVAGNGTVVVITLAFDAPTAGIVVVNAGDSGVASLIPDGQNSCPCEATPRLHHLLGWRDEVAPYATAIDIASVATAADADTGGISYPFLVAAGRNTFEVRGSKLSGAANTLLTGQATAIFVPFGGTGKPGNLDEPLPPANAPPAQR